MQNEGKEGMLRVAYLGPSASFSHQAAREAFAQSASVLHQPVPSFAAIFAAIQGRSQPGTESSQVTYLADFAVLPVENSTNGGVVQVLDLLIQCGLDLDSCLYPDVEVIAEHYLEVHHCLFVHPSTIKNEPFTNTTSENVSTNLASHISSLNITSLYTHPQVWGQCTRFLSKHLPPPGTERIDVSSTSAAAAFVAQNSLPSREPSAINSTQQEAPTAKPTGTIAAISSSLAGEQHNLTCLATNIEDEPGQNTTRFLVIRNRKRTSLPIPTYLLQTSHPSSNQPTTTSLKSLVTFTVPHSQPGSLASALAVFRSHNFNLTAITTRPSRERNWHYVFFVECEDQRPNQTDGGDHRLQGMLSELKSATERMCLLGTWVDRLRHR